jgi:hypothetical protein
MLASIVGGLIILLIGLAFTFLGYRLFMVLLPVWGFFGGFWLGANALTLIFGDGFLATTTSWIVGFFAGLFFALFSYVFYFLGVAVVAGILGYALGVGFMGLFGLEGGLIVFGVGVVTALVVVLVTMVFNLQKYVVIILTSLAGGLASVIGGLIMFTLLSPDTLRQTGDAIQAVASVSQFWLLVAFILGVVGIVSQLRVNRSYEFSKDDYVRSWG